MSDDETVTILQKEMDKMDRHTVTVTSYDKKGRVVAESEYEVTELEIDNSDCTYETAEDGCIKLNERPGYKLINIQARKLVGHK